MKILQAALWIITQEKKLDKNFTGLEEREPNAKEYIFQILASSRK